MSRKRNKRTRVRRAVAESVAAPAREAVREAGVAKPTKPGRMLVRLISAGWSKNGRYYPAEVLKRDGARVWPAGTQSFIDHQPDEEEEKFPVGSVKNLAAVLTEDPRWDEESKALVAEARLFEPWTTPLMEMARAEKEDGVPAVGLSIRAYATGEHGEAEGRSGMIIDRLEEGISVDFVTKAAAGGKILAILESIQNHQVAETRTIGTWLESRLHLVLTQFADDMYGDGRLTRAERITLSSAIGDGLDAYTGRIETDAPQLYKRGLWDDAPAEGTVEEALTDDTRARLQRAISVAHGDEDEEYPGVWVYDFDPDEQLVIFSNDGKTWRQSYTDEDGIALAGDPIEVARRTTYEPVEAAEAAPVAPSVEVDRVPVTEMADELARADQALQRSPIQESVTASADGSPPTANPTPEGESTMSGTTTEAPKGPEAGTNSSAPVDEAVAVITSERDQFRARCTSLTEALTESQSAQRKAEAVAEQAVARARLLEGNEAGRVTVDRMLGADEAGIPEGMYGTVAPRVHNTIRGQVPMTDDGKVDQPALEALIASAIKAEREYAARILESQGVGQPSGLGYSDPNTITDEAFDAEQVEMYRSIGLDEDTAKLASKGR